MFYATMSRVAARQCPCGGSFMVHYQSDACLNANRHPHGTSERSARRDGPTRPTLDPRRTIVAMAWLACSGPMSDCWHLSRDDDGSILICSARPAARGATWCRPESLTRVYIQRLRPSLHQLRREVRLLLDGLSPPSAERIL
jgi:hypothetical protein